MTPEDGQAAALLQTRLMTQRVNRDLISAVESLTQARRNAEEGQFGLASSQLTNLLTTIGQCIASTAALAELGKVLGG